MSLIISIRPLAACSFALTLLVSLLHADTPKGFSDKAGHELQFVSGGRYVQGTTGGETRLSRAFPLSTTGQFFGNAESPAHLVWITKPFYIAKHEVTVGQFQRFVAATGYKTSAESGKTEMVGWDPTPEDKPLYQSHDFRRDSKFDWKQPGFKQEPNHPVVGVSWADAKAYCDWLSQQEGVTYRLPTEAEWELACRAGTSTWFSFGDVAQGVAHKHGNLGNVELEKHRKHSAERQWLMDWDNAPHDGYVFTAPVGHYHANPWGLHDMHGNVWEWCEDLWLDTFFNQYKKPRYDQPCETGVDPFNGDQPQTTTNDFHAIRGGSWYNGDIVCRSANRTYWDRDDAACYVGFRVVREASPEAPRPFQQSLEREREVYAKIEAAGGRVYSSDGLDVDVRFSGDHFDESIFESLKHLPELRRLTIGWQTRDAYLSEDAISSISKLSSLEELEFHRCLDPTQLNLAPLTRLKRLKSLSFPRVAPIQDRHLKSLAGFESLTEFSCYGTNGLLTDAGIEQLSGNAGLSALRVWECDATGAFLEAFSECPLRELAVTRRYNGKGTLQQEPLNAIGQFGELTTLELTGQSQLDSLEFLVELPMLERLVLDGCSGLTDAELSRVGHLTRLRELRLRDTQAGELTGAAIGEIPRIRSLEIRSDNLSNDAIKSIAQAFSLQYLNIASIQMDDDALRHLGRINRLDRLVVQSPRITGQGLGPVAELPDLKDVSLLTPGLTDLVFEHFSQSKSILKLRLAHRGSKPPAALTDDGMVKMQKAKQLKELWLPRNGTAMTEAKMNELNQQMPQTGVIPYTVAWEEE